MTVCVGGGGGGVSIDSKGGAVKVLTSLETEGLHVCCSVILCVYVDILYTYIYT